LAIAGAQRQNITDDITETVLLLPVGHPSSAQFISNLCFFSATSDVAGAAYVHANAAAARST
jgi:hypothetical protein